MGFAITEGPLMKVVMIYAPREVAVMPRVPTILVMLLMITLVVLT